MLVFDRPGPMNTERVAEIASGASPRCNFIVVASVTGESALKIAQKVKDKKIVCVTCPQGMYWEVDKMDVGPFAEIPELKTIRDAWKAQGHRKVTMTVDQQNTDLLEKNGITVVKGTIPFFGPSFSMRLHLNQTTSLDIVAKTLELISTGTLVCLECVLMAVDAGEIPESEKVMALAGTERGLDTAWIIKSSASANLFHPEKGARFIELLAKPGISLVPDIMVEYLR
jgi:uncharacterized protein